MKTHGQLATEYQKKKDKLRNGFIAQLQKIYKNATYRKGAVSESIQELQVEEGKLEVQIKEIEQMIKKES